MPNDNQNSTVAEGHDKPCSKCNRTDGDDKWVCCDNCETWQHFQCAGVDDSIKDKSWKCDSCLVGLEGTTKSVVSFNESSVSKSSRVSQKLQLSLQHLEEQRKLKKSRAEEELKSKKLEEEARLKQFKEEEEFLKQKYGILMQIEDEKAISGRRSGVSVKSRRDQLENWFKGAKPEGGENSKLPVSVSVSLPIKNQPSTIDTRACQQPSNQSIPVPVVSLRSSVPASSNSLVLPTSTSGNYGHVTSLARTYELLAQDPMPISDKEGTNRHVIPVVSTAGQGNINALSMPTTSENPVLHSGLLPSSLSVPLVSERDRVVYATSRMVPQVTIHSRDPIPTWSGDYTGLFPTVNQPFTGLSSSSNALYGNIPTTLNASQGGQAGPLRWQGPSVPYTGTGPGVCDVRNNPGPTNVQLAARQVMPRELPKFNGNPQEWPLFYSSFKNTSDACGYSDAENLARLQRSLGGPALEAVRSRLLLPASVPYVMETLYKFYGRPEILIASLLQKVRNVPSPKSEDLNTIVVYGLAVQSLVDHITIADQQAHLSNPLLLQELVDKLPTTLKLQWGKYKHAFMNVNLATFNSFMSELVNLASDLTSNIDIAQNLPRQTKVGNLKQKEKLFTHASEAPGASVKDVNVELSKSCSYCGSNGHLIVNCTDFKSLDISRRWKAMRQKNLCRLCLIPHRKWPCRSNKECGVDGCRVRHHMLLHSSRNETVNVANRGEAVHQNHHYTKSYSLFRYLPVTLYGDGVQVDTFVFLDDGSSSTLIDEEIATKLGVKGEPDNLWLSWTGKIGREEKLSRRISLKISAVGKNKIFQLNNVRTVSELALPEQTLNYEELSHAFPHLQGLPVTSYVQAKPGMIIGLEHVCLLTSLKIREGCSSDPVATRTRLGWCIYGRSSGSKESVEQLHRHSEDNISNSDLYGLMRKFFAVEDAAVTKQIESDEIERARRILEDTTIRKGSRIECGLLWRKDDLVFPETQSMAISRLQGLERRLSRDPQLHSRVVEQIQSYEQKRYIKKSSFEEVNNMSKGRVWYLPLGVVVNPKKPNKIRMVWDAAAKAGGVCFNDMLLKGPDLLVSLVDVLLRFRQGRVAVCSDIREMFLQIPIREADKWSQCFLWRSNMNEKVQVYVINVAMFGATSSPCIAQYVKNKNALDYAEQYPRAAEAVIRNHYVDDFLDSVDSPKEAVELVRQVQTIHAATGFEFGKILSNAKEVLDCLGETGIPTNKSLSLDKESMCERVLGVEWAPGEDHFTFDGSGLKEVLGSNKKIPTKRQVLRIVMKLYDPLGFIAHFVVQGKILMQEIWRTGTNWDEPIAQQLHESWYRWSEWYESIGNVKVPRYLFGPFISNQIKETQIHVFTDASEAACACVAYLRVTSEDESQCSLTLIGAKTKVAPLRSLSIPRLELQAAMMGARLLHSICSALTVRIQRCFLWTDSATVLAWLRSDNRRYHPFVSFRVSEILTLTSVDQWRYVPSRLNAADDATKWKPGLTFNPDCRWYRASSFLYDPESQWHKEKSTIGVEGDATKEELQVVAVHQTVEEVIDANRFSRWNRLLRTMAYVHRAVAIMKRSSGDKRQPKILVQNEYVRAESTLWRQAQAQAYANEVRLISEGCNIGKESPLQPLAPFLDDDGLLRVGSRIENAPNLSFAAKYPVILPRNHRITYLIVFSFHQRFLHANGETICNELRQQFYIPKLRVLVRTVGRECQYCKIKRAAPTPPMMGPLPKVRLTPFIRPFTNVGVDYMGPFEVKVGRSVVKRWICLFTCLTIRAIHLELAHSLSTSSCVMAFRRFVARRGAPLEVFSDNGTNFVGANRQLSEEVRKIKEINEHCAATFTNAYTQWHFNVPAAPHMGGPWERMVKSVKVAMKAISDNPRHVSDEVLETIMLEAEGIVNSRPLTYVPLEATDQEALTPNHFLLYGSNGIKQPSKNIVHTGNILRESWALSQRIVDEIWRRWVLEYLPMLARRAKWFDAVKPLEKGDLVLVVDERVRNCWERGRIIETFPDKSGQVRRAKVLTARGIFERPAVKLARLDVTNGSKKPEGVASGPEMAHGSGDVADTPRCGEK